MFSSLAGLVLRKPNGCDYYGGLSAYHLGHAMGGGDWHLVWTHTQSGYQEPAQPVVNDVDLKALHDRLSSLESLIANLMTTVIEVHASLDLLREQVQLSYVEDLSLAPSLARECDFNVGESATTTTTTLSPCRVPHGEGQIVQCYCPLFIPIAGSCCNEVSHASLRVCLCFCVPRRCAQQ